MEMNQQDTFTNLPSVVRDYNFYQLVELLHSIGKLQPEEQGWERACKIIFTSNTSLGFAASDVHSLSTGFGGAQLAVNFLGLSGSQSPLPNFIVEQLIDNEYGELKTQFFDFFNNRLIALVYRIWRKYRYYVRYQAGAVDPFSERLFSLVGLGHSELRSDDGINWCKMLAYAGTLASRSRSPQVVSGIIAHYFELKQVDIRQWVQRKVLIERNQQFSLGVMNARLGEETVIGSSVLDINSKFCICIGGLSRERFMDFLPSGAEYKPLSKLLDFMLREQIAFDLELTLDEEEVPPFSLARGKEISLGWTSFLYGREKSRPVLLQVRR